MVRIGQAITLKDDLLASSNLSKWIKSGEKREVREYYNEYELMQVTGRSEVACYNIHKQ